MIRPRVSLLRGDRFSCFINLPPAEKPEPKNKAELATLFSAMLDHAFNVEL